MSDSPGLARAIVLASTIALVTTIIIARSGPSTTGNLVSVPIAETLPPPNRFFGRDAFVPDWHRAEEIDSVASTHFLENYWPDLKPARYRQISSARQQSSVQLFDANYWNAVDPDQQTQPAVDPSKRIRLFAAQGESEPVAIGIRSGSSAQSISITATQFRSDTGYLEAQFVTNRLMLTYTARRHRGRKQTDMIEQPMVLLKPPANAWTFPPATSMTYVIDFHVPPDQPAGKYRGALIVSVDGEELRRIAVSVTVLPFSLKMNGYHAGAFGATYDIWAGGFTGYTQEMIEMDSRYGFNLAGGFFNKGFEVPFRRTGKSTVTIDTHSEKFDRFHLTMQRLANFGMGDVAFWNWGASGNVQQFNRILIRTGFSGIETIQGKRGFAAICAELKRAEGIYGWPEFVLNPYDEALKDQDATREIIAAAPIVQRLSPQTRLYMTEWRAGYTQLYQSSGRVLRGSGRPREPELHALAAEDEPPRLNFQVIGSNTLSEESARLQHRLGGEYWHYGGASHLTANARLVYGFIPWIVRADASLVWANYKGDFLGNGWTVHHAMPLNPDGRAQSDTRGPIIASARAIAIREGIDDRKYIETLRYYATLHGSIADLTYLDGLSRRARELVTNLRRIGGIHNTEAATANNRAMDHLRAEIRDRITSLLKRQQFADGLK